MEMNQSSNRIHPLIAGAAASVMLVSLLGAAAITGILPNSNSTPAPAVATAAPIAATAPATPLIDTRMAAQPIAAPAQYAAQAPAQAAAAVPTVVHKHVVVHEMKPARAQQASVYKQPEPARTQPAVYRTAEPAPQQVQAPVYQPQPAPVAQQNSPIGIGVGAVVGGLIGNQIGKGNGRKLATVAGAVAGGYIGNEVAKHTP